MRLQDMSILEKANKLEGLLAKAELDVDYAITIEWKNNAEDDKRTAKIAIENARTMFASPRIKSLDSDVQADTYANYNALLDSCLKMFPEYINNDVVTESVNPGMHI